MIISAIVAMDENNAIGRDNELPWHLPDDFKFFKKTTLGKPVLMGRKTYESLGKPLVKRLNIVISSKEELDLPDGVLHYHTLEGGIERLKQESTEEGFVIGGGNIYKQCMPMLNRLYITRVHMVIEDAEAFFPEVDAAKWELVWKENHPADEKHKYAFTFQQWERIEG